MKTTVATPDDPRAVLARALRALLVRRLEELIG